MISDCYSRKECAALAYCKKLTCRTCAGKLCSTLKDSLLAAIAEHQLLYFVTLTLPGDVKPGQQERKLKKSFSKLKRAANRAFGDISYVWVVSCHRNGSLHLHMLTNTDLRRGSENGKQIEWLKQKWHRLTGAHQARCASFPIRDANNLAAYMVKNLITGVLTRPEIIRRRGCSRCVNWRAQIEREEDGTEWSFLRKPTALVVSKSGVPDGRNSWKGYRLAALLLHPMYLWSPLPPIYRRSQAGRVACTPSWKLTG